MKQWTLIIDVEKCENCNSCFLACKDEHCGNAWPGVAAPQPLHGHRWMNILRKERGRFPQVDVAYLPKPCMHCEQAPCVAAAPDGAVYRRPDGIVIIDPEKARGRKDLLNACPYGAIWWNPGEQVPQKCTFCAHLLDSGWQKPRCVQACPTGALSVLHLEAAELGRRIADERLDRLEPTLGTFPRVLYRNLYRYKSCFITGSLFSCRDGCSECASGVRVELSKDGKILQTCASDAFGDFKMDGLPPGGGPYTLRFAGSGRRAFTLDLPVQDSVCLGTINLDDPRGSDLPCHQAALT